MRQRYEMTTSMPVAIWYSDGAKPMSEAEPRAKDEAWNEQREKPE